MLFPGTPLLQALHGRAVLLLGGLVHGRAIDFNGAWVILWDLQCPANDFSEFLHNTLIFNLFLLNFSRFSRLCCEQITAVTLPDGDKFGVIVRLSCIVGLDGDFRIVFCDAEHPAEHRDKHRPAHHTTDVVAVAMAQKAKV